MPNDAPLGDVRSQVTAEEWQARVDLAACYRLLARYNMADLTGTHTSVSVPGSDNQHFLINPHGMLFEMVTASSLVKIDWQGQPVMASPHRVNPAGFIIHSAIHMARPDAVCVMHTHTTAGLGVAMQAQGLLPASQHACFFTGNLGYHDIDAMEQGLDGRAVLARDLGPHRALIMRNHGLLTCGRTIGEAFWLMHTLERACQAQIAALAGGSAIYPVTDKTSRWFGSLLSEQDFSLDRGNLSWPGLLAVLDSVDPSYRT
jgi:ribulose-5-phosphate 4-epimerase/fuculose-1-phosphate aldolase